MSSPEPQEEFRIPLVWVGVEEEPVAASNQMVIQHSARDEFILTFGMATPPIVLGDEEQRREELERVTYVPVTPVARVAFTRQRLQALITVLQENLATHDRTFGE